MWRQSRRRCPSWTRQAWNDTVHMTETAPTTGAVSLFSPSPVSHVLPDEMQDAGSKRQEASRRGFRNKSTGKTQPNRYAQAEDNSTQVK
jgi:hypothetical protein